MSYDQRRKQVLDRMNTNMFVVVNMWPLNTPRYRRDGGGGVRGQAKFFLVNLAKKWSTKNDDEDEDEDIDKCSPSRIDEETVARIDLNNYDYIGVLTDTE